MQNFMGMDGFIWFTGVVEDRNDPSKLGRVRVRCVGHHTDDKSKIPTADLPWAHVMHPVTDPSMNGMGTTPTFMVEGTWVVGFFMDAEDKQQPIIIGTLPGVPDEKPNTSKGFYDPNGVYPKTDFLEESDVNRLARGETENTIVETKNATRFKRLPQADGNYWNEPETTYKATYPKNHVFESESGHIVEYDDTSDSERVHVYHKEGTFYEIDKDGNKHERIIGDRYQIIQGDDYRYSDDLNITVRGTLNIKCKDLNIEVERDYIDEVGRDKKSFIEGDIEFHTQTKVDIFAKNTVNIDTASLDVDASTVIALTSDITTINGVTTTNIRGATVNLEGTTSNIVGTTVSIDGTTVDIDGTTVDIDANTFSLDAPADSTNVAATSLGLPGHGISQSVSISDITSPGTVVVTDPTEPDIATPYEPTSATVGGSDDENPINEEDGSRTGGDKTKGGISDGSARKRKKGVRTPPGDCKRPELGAISAIYESGSDGPATIGKSKTDGYAYGTYQISTRTGTFADFMSWMDDNEYGDVRKQIDGIGGTSGASSGSATFQRNWKSLANGDNAKRFAQAQHDYIQNDKYDPVVASIKDEFGIDICDGTHSNGLQDAVWSTAVQHGEGGAPYVFRKALARTGKTVDTVTDAELIEAIYDERSRVDAYFKSSPSLHQGLRDRFAAEKADALANNSNTTFNLDATALI